MKASTLFVRALSPANAGSGFIVRLIPGLTPGATTLSARSRGLVEHYGLRLSQKRCTPWKSCRQYWSEESPTR